MSEWTITLEFEEGTSSKFWRARVDGGTLYVNYGKIGTNGQTQVKDLGDAAAATKEYDKLVREKRKKGYVDSEGGAPPAKSAPAAESAPAPASKPTSAPPPAAPQAPAASAARPRPTGGTRFVLQAGNRQVETYVTLDGKTLHMESTETHATPESAKAAFERLKKALGVEGYKEG